MNRIGLESRTCCAIAAGSIVFGYVIYRRFTFWKRQDVPNSLTLFVDMVRQPFHVVDMKYVQKFGTVIGFYNGAAPTLLIADVELARQVMLNDFDNFRNRIKSMRETDVMGESLLFARDDTWKKLRNQMTPTFSSAKLRRMQPVIENSCRDLVEAIALSMDSSTEMDMKPFFSGFTLDVIASSAFGIKINSAKDPTNDFTKYGMMLSNNDMTIEFLLVLLFADIAVDWLGCSILNRKPGKYFSQLTHQILNERRRDLSAHERNDFLQLMIEAQLNEKQIADNGVLFFLAGFDTTAITLTNTVYLLALNQNSQQKLINEIDNYLYDNKQEINYETLMDLKYLEAVINETLRMMPTFPRTVREAQRDCKLGNIFVPRGTAVWISNYAIHHDANNFEEPEEFIPERWLDGNNGLRHNNHAFIAFSTGPRNCIGMRFATYEMKLCLVHLLKKYKFERSFRTKIPLEHFAGQIVMGARDVYLHVVKR